MSTQSGGDGYGKVKKSCQTGGASGWAKHCGDTKDHQMSNRAERRLAKDELVEQPVRMRGRRRDKVPSRRHLLQRLEHLDAEIAREKKWREDHKNRLPVGHRCYMCSDRWLHGWRREKREKLIKEFEKHGYEKP